MNLDFCQNLIIRMIWNEIKKTQKSNLQQFNNNMIELLSDVTSQWRHFRRRIIESPLNIVQFRWQDLRIYIFSFALKSKIWTIIHLIGGNTLECTIWFWNEPHKTVTLHMLNHIKVLKSNVVHFKTKCYTLIWYPPIYFDAGILFLIQ